jgi:urease accessory protein
MNRRDAEAQRRNVGILSMASSEPLHQNGENDFLVWQLVDSAFPTGGFAHSAGLEAAWQNGEIRNRKELGSFLEASLEQLGHAALPFVTAAYQDVERVTEFDQLCDAFTSNHVANRASRLQGRAFFYRGTRL